MAWTEMQKKAIYLRGSNILVSAGAGSGKTAVLSERVLEYCLSGGNIQRLLVLTFTNAAASEMKERIRKKLLEHHLDEQASLIDSAYITTFDAYSLSLVKKYYYALKLDKDVKVIDQSLLEVKKRTLLEEYFQELYEKKDEAFFSLLKKYAKQNDDAVKKMVLGIYNSLSLIVDEDSYCKNYTTTFGSDAFLRKITATYEQMILKKLSKLSSQLESFSSWCFMEGDEKMGNSAMNIMNQMASIRSYDDLALLTSQFTLPRISSKVSEALKDEKKKCSEAIKKFIEDYCTYGTLEDAFGELKWIQPEIETLLNLALNLKKRIEEYEASMMAFDYMDIAKMAIRLVSSFPKIHDEISNQFDEILVDEYQDTSDIQEAFINAISHDNCYMVGDIKQSIYRFRNANPYIFKAKYEAYGKNQGGTKIDLTHNFRSRKEVIDNINDVFNSLMTNTCGDADYSLEHQMHYGQKEYEKQSFSYDFNMEILSYDSLEGFSDEEVEAFLCGKEIKKLMEEPIMSLGKEGYRLPRYADIAILIDKTKSFITFKRVFEYLHIPLKIEADLDLNDSILPRLFSNILICLVHLKNQVFDPAYFHALSSIARSFLCGYTDTTIYSMIHENKTTGLNDILEELLQNSNHQSLQELFREMLISFEVYKKLPLIGDIENSCVVLEYLDHLFATMSVSAMSLEEGATFLKDTLDSGIALKYQLAGSNTDSVHIMTIHKSKGLEFPYCFFPMLAGQFNKEDMKKTFGLSKRWGIYIPFSDETNSNTILKKMADEEAKREDISEKVRLFYVALTRAREKIVLISNDKEYADTLLEQDHFASFNHMLRSLRFLDEKRQKIDVTHLGISKDYLLPRRIEQLPKGKTLVYQEDPFETSLLEKKAISKELKELVTPALEQAILLGQEFHHCLEVLDLAHPKIDELPVQPMIKAALKKILSHPIFSKIGEAKTYHEYEFYFEEYHGIIDLLVLYEDHIDIIDYKLSNLDSNEYLRQLNIYKNYVSSVSNLPVRGYLLSILKQEMKQIF